MIQRGEEATTQREAGEGSKRLLNVDLDRATLAYHVPLLGQIHSYAVSASGRLWENASYIGGVFGLIGRLGCGGGKPI